MPQCPNYMPPMSSILNHACERAVKGPTYDTGGVKKSFRASKTSLLIHRQPFSFLDYRSGQVSCPYK